MSNIQIKTDGTIQGTVLVVDGKEVTKDQKVTSIYFNAQAGFKSKYSGEEMKGYASAGYEVLGDNGKLERRSFGQTETPYSEGIGEKVEENDDHVVQQDSVLRFVGSPVDEKIVKLVDSIVKHCEEKQLKCRPREVLLERKIESLKDIALDYGIEIKD